MEQQLTTSPASYLVHPILTGEQAELMHQALIGMLNMPSEQLGTVTQAEEEQVRQELSQLVFFFDRVVSHPEEFGLRSVEDTKRIARTHRAGIKGPAQPRSLRGKRKVRQATRMATAKRRRKENRINKENYNQAVKIMNDEAKEAEEIQEAEVNKQVERFEKLGRKEAITSEELQEILELFGSPEGAARVRELRRDESDTWGRIERAAANAAVSDE